jgi:amino acid adenylation domain-containing protein
MITDRPETGQRKRSESDTVDHPDLQSHVQVADEFRQFTKEEIEQSIPVRFEKIVRLYPDRLAVKAGDCVLTYDDLNRYANRIARAILEKRGPGSEPIALLFEHGIDVIAAIFGVLKAGKFFVALDPLFPSARMNLIVEDCQAKLIVTNNYNLSRARQLPNAIDAILNLDEIDSNLAGENLGSTISPETISSIMYTSGSTGTPKGVIDTHGNILESARYLAETVKLIVDDRLSLLHTLAYASARTYVFLSLLNGASLFPFDLRSEGAEHLAEWVSGERITILYCPVVLFRQFADLHSELIPLPSLRVLHVSGAPITRNDFELYKRRFHDGVLLEISMGSTEARGIGIAVLNKQFSFPSKGNPVGYAPPGKRILILDSTHKALPKGEVGEIAVQGKNLNPGYWRMPELTKSKYLPDPSGGDERIYLTGDLGRMLPDGFLIYLGREDLMVKIRGYRVDIGEVERALLEYPQVKEAGVAAWDRDSGEKNLVAYVVPRQKSALDVSELNEFLRNKLPDYMIPSTFMFLESLPLTNGKLNRSALPKPDARRPNLKTPYAPPRNDVERTLSQIWSEILSLDQTGIHDNFFDLGGHSLAATRVVSQVIKTFQLAVPLKALFESPTVADMALLIMQNQAKKVGQEDLERMLAEVEAMSEEEANKLLPDESVRSVRRGINE